MKVDNTMFLFLSLRSFDENKSKMVDSNIIYSQVTNLRLFPNERLYRDNFEFDDNMAENSSKE